MDSFLTLSWDMALGVLLVVEDGSIVPGANTFVTLAEARAYADLRGLSLPPDDAAASRVILKGGDFLRSLEPRFSGYRVSNDQTMPFPRIGVPVAGRPGWYYDEDEIPSVLKEAQIEFAVYLASGGSLYPSASASRSVKKRKVGPIETEFFEGGSSGSNWTTLVPSAYTLLLQLMGGVPGYMTSRRV